MRARVQLCGRFVVEVDGRAVEPALPGRQGRLLVGYLTVNRDRRCGRDELVDAVWGAAAPRGADASLSALLSRIREAIRPVPLEGRGALRLALGPGALIDVEQAVAAVHLAESAVALDRPLDACAPALTARFITAREFLPGLAAPWVDDWRERLEDVHLRALEAYGAACFAVGGTELPAAGRAATELVRRAPLREAGYRLLMRTRMARGNTAEALRIYEDLANLLRAELGARPSPETRALYELLLQTT